MRLFSLSLALALAFPHLERAEARWQVNSEFQLHLPEPAFDQLIQDFWQSLQGERDIPVSDISVNIGDARVAVNGINVKVNYEFSLPQRTDPAHREWELHSEKLGAKVTASRLQVTRKQVVNVGDINIITDVTIVCRDIALALPEGSASIGARVRAEVAQNQVQLTLPSYSAQWPDGAWQLQSLDCPDLAQIPQMVQQQVLDYLSSFRNMDAAVSSALTAQFEAWSKDASVLLLSRQDLPTTGDFLKVHYEPQTAAEAGSNNGLILGGILRFDYPHVAQGQDLQQDFRLPTGSAVAPQGTPQLLMPFATIRSLMMGQYFAGKLEYSMRSTEVPAFTALMQNRWRQFLAWPDLMRFPKESVFLFQFQPLGPPFFDNETAGSGNTINGDLSLPLNVRTYAPLGGLYEPYVEFRTMLSGPASLKMQSDGKVDFKISATEQPATYAFAQRYAQYYRPDTRIALQSIVAASRDTLHTEGLQLKIPPIKIGKRLELAPSSWNLQKDKALRLDFTVKEQAAK